MATEYRMRLLVDAAGASRLMFNPIKVKGTEPALVRCSVLPEPGASSSGRLLLEPETCVVLWSDYIRAPIVILGVLRTERMSG